MNTPEQLTQLSAQTLWPAFSADGRSLAFASGRGQAGVEIRVYLMDANGGHLQKMPSFGKDDFSPVFDHANGLLAYPLTLNFDVRTWRRC